MIESLAAPGRVLRIVSARFAVCLLAALPLSAQTLADVYAKMDASSQSFKAMTADIKQTAHTAVVNDDSTEFGIIRLKRAKGNDTRILVDFTRPEPKTVSIDGGKVSMLLPKAKTVQNYDLRAKKAALEQGMLLGFGASGADVQAAYDVTLVGKEAIAGQPTSHIHLVPKSKEVLQNLKSADLWISDSLGAPVQQKFITTSGGDYTLIQYSNMKINPSIADKDLKLSVPKGFQVQEIGK
ncbi:MAG TPA: outer-membrane lipoprotein carrier protein LolA [Bryobacteraceae bacterium]|nr:outer-membrane lipoprotein carrier protein LolA [Bryobacteraceae bacterium]